MKPTLLLAAAFCTAAHAAPAPAPRPAPPGPVIEAITALAQEVSSNTPASTPLQQRLDALLQFRPTAATAAKLTKIYGSTPPWTFSRTPAKGGASEYHGALAPLHFRGADGSTVDWDKISLELGMRSDGNAINFIGGTRNIASSDSKVRIALRDMAFEGLQHRSADNLWFGGAFIDIASVSFEPVGGGQRVAFEGIRTDQRMVDQQSRIELAYQLGVRRIAVGADGIDNVKLHTRITALDRQTMLALQAEGTQPLPAGATVQERQARLAPLLKTIAHGAVRAGTALEIDELSASFHGQPLRASGRIFLDGAVDSDADSPQALLKKLAVKLSVKAPLALLREVSKSMAALQVRAKNQGKDDPQAVAQLAASINDIALGKMVSSGFVRVDGDMLISDIDYSAAKGGWRVNGKPVAAPNMAGVPAFATASPQMMQARRIDERCTLPDYPADVIAADAPLSLTMRLLVKADGSVRNVVLSTPSTRPDYDQQVLAAAARCVYIPALRNGQPADAPVLWKVAREAGSKHP
ncbi:MAG: hypothetical protein JWP59_1344 [Massilia sp.]|nr:hypothetical protein [Massilia sp.]